jgi:hypothetical protein
VGNLEINSQGNGTVLENAQDANLSWYHVRSFGKIGYGMPRNKYGSTGSKQKGYGGGKVENRFDQYRVEIYDSAGSTLKRTAYVEATDEEIGVYSYNYTAAFNTADFGSFETDIQIRVYAEYDDGEVSAASTITTNT